MGTPSLHTTLMYVRVYVCVCVCMCVYCNEGLVLSKRFKHAFAESTHLVVPSASNVTYHMCSIADALQRCVPPLNTVLVRIPLSLSLSFSLSVFLSFFLSFFLVKSSIESMHVL